MKVVASVKRRPTSSATSLRSTLATDGASMDVRDRARLVWEVLDRAGPIAYLPSGPRARRRTGRSRSGDRYPLPQVSGMDGAVTARTTDPGRWGGLARALAAREKGYYDRIRYPDILIVLRVHPDIAVQRKAGVEPESTVRPRSGGDLAGRLDGYAGDRGGRRGTAGRGPVRDQVDRLVEGLTVRTQPRGIPDDDSPTVEPRTARGARTAHLAIDLRWEPDQEGVAQRGRIDGGAGRAIIAGLLDQPLPADEAR